MDERYEYALATEGMPTDAEDQWIAYEERMALAPDLKSKQALVQSEMGQTMPDADYRSAMGVLMEVQALLDGKTAVSAQEAEEILKARKEEVERKIRTLDAQGWWRKSRRVEYRLRLMELETAIRVGMAKEEIEKRSKALATPLGVSLSDAAPAIADVDASASAYPTELSDKSIQMQELLEKVTRSLCYLEDEHYLTSRVREELEKMDAYAREVFFQQVQGWKPGDVPGLSDKTREIVLKLFLDDYRFEFTNLPGYLELIAEDMKEDDGTEHKPRQFGSRGAHMKLSLSPLRALLEKRPELREDIRYLVRVIELMQADQQSALRSHLRDADRDRAEVASIDRCRKYLSDIGPSANSIKVCLLNRQLQLLRFKSDPDKLLAAFLEYITIPRFGVDYVNSDYIKSATGVQLVAFSQPSSSYLYRQSIRPTSAMFVSDIASALGYKRISSHDDLNLIKSVLYHLWECQQLSNGDEKRVRTYLDKNLVEDEKAWCMVKSGCGELSQWIGKLPQKGAELPQFAKSTEISFCKSNPSYYAPEDEMEVFIRVRNVKTLTVQVYEVRTIDYYSRTRHEVRGNICLDGLLPNEEHQIDLSHLSPWNEARIPVKVSSKSIGKRGVFVVEAFEKDTTCRAILRKGFLRHVEQITSRGHEFTVMDESGEVLKEAFVMVTNVKSGSSRAQPPRTYNSDASGVIVVPFRERGESAGDEFSITFCHDVFGFFHSSFEYLERSFHLQAQFYVDSEQLRPGETASLITRPILSLAGSRHSILLTQLQNIALKITYSTANSNANAGVSKTTEQSFETMDEFLSAERKFEIPLDADGFTVELSARVTPDDGKVSDPLLLPLVSCPKYFTVRRVNKFESTFTMHFHRRPTNVEASSASGSDYVISVLGHNGEPIPNKVVEIRLKHLHFSEQATTILQSDELGEIKLGSLHRIESVTARFYDDGDGNWTWELPNLRTHKSEAVQCAVGDVIELPIPFEYATDATDWLAKGLISLCRKIAPSTGGNIVLEAVSEVGVLDIVADDEGEAIGIMFRPKAASDYVLCIRPLDIKYPVTVGKEKRAHALCPHGAIMEGNRFLVGSSTRALSIVSQRIVKEDEKQVLQVKIANGSSESTQVWVVCKRFFDCKDQQLSSVVVSEGLTGCKQGDMSFEMSPFANEFLEKRKISDEYTYILQRRGFVQANPDSLLLCGSASMPKPSLLQNPYVIDESDMEDIVLREGEKVTGFSEEQRKMKRSMGSTRAGFGGCCPAMAAESSISFLDGPSICVRCLPTTDASVFSVTLSDLTEFAGKCPAEIISLAIDTSRGQVITRELLVVLNEEATNSMPPTRDVRLPPEEALHASLPSMQIQSLECLRAGETRVITRTFSSQYALYETLGSAMDLWTTMCSDPLLKGLVVKLEAWPTMKKSAKLEFYYKNASDDFNFFLVKKDPAFFVEYVKPLVEAKLCKSLMDLCLIGDEALVRERYLVPAVFARLSVVEKLLIAQSMSKSEDVKRICQHVIANIGNSVSEQNCELLRVFDTVLSQGAVKPTPPSPSPPAPQALRADLQYDMGGMPASYESAHLSSLQNLSMPMSMSCRAYSGAPPFAPGGYIQPLSSRQCAAPMLQAMRCSLNRHAETLSGFDANDDEDEESDASSSSEEVEDDDVDDDEVETNDRKQLQAGKRTKPYIMAGKVRRAQEKRYFSTQKPHVDGRNMFWKEYAKYLMQRLDNGEASAPIFLSSYFPEALGTLTEGILAMSVLNLAVKAAPTSVQQLPGGVQVKLEAAANVILYHQGIGSGAVADEPNSTLLMQQKIVPLSERPNLSSDFSDIKNSKEILINRIYSCVVNVSNISSSRLSNLNLLVQIPQGAIPLTSSFTTKNQVVEVGPHDTISFAFNFYFPSVGRFEHYPAHLAQGGKVVAWASTATGSNMIDVVSKATVVDLTSWNDVAARGTLSDVMTYMKSKKNVRQLDFSALRWRCKDHDFYTAIVQFLREKMIYEEGVWKYALLHKDSDGMSELIAGSTDFLKTMGCGVEVSLLHFNKLFSQERFEDSFSFDHTEFGPFLSRRAHRVAGKTNGASTWNSSEISSSGGEEQPRILNKNAREYYHTLCASLSLLPRLEQPHLLVLCYFMILFNRIPDAMKVFARLQGLIEDEMHSGGESTVVYDYIDSYLDFFRPINEDDACSNVFPVARRNTKKYARLAHERWAERFRRLADVLQEYDELNGASDTTKEAESVGVAQTSSRIDVEIRLDAEIDGDQIQLKSFNLGQCEISFYRIDVELMFSTEPFDSFSDSASSKSSLLLVEPWKRIAVDLNEDGANATTTTTFRIPSDLTSSQMMLRIREVVASRRVSTVAAPIDLTRSYFNSQLQVDVMTQAGMLQVLHGGRPVKSCYVKAYAKASLSDGSKHHKATFYKDGYTDIIGKFDYAAINGDLLSRVEKFSLLVSHPVLGATVKQVAPPVLATTSSEFQDREAMQAMWY